MRDLLYYKKNSEFIKKRVVIYGAGSAGAQLERNLSLTNSYKVIYFLDDSSSLIGRSLHGIPINSPQKINSFINDFDMILIALPSVERERVNQIIINLEKFDKPLLQVPSVDQLTSKEVQIDSLNPIPIELLLGRKPAPQDKEECQKVIKNKVICVTGAGGSIGSELCRKIFELKPKKLIMIENSEINLYSINQELISNQIQIELIPILGNILDTEFVGFILKKYNVEIVYHAAAYKHVPLVEKNVLQGLLNNVIGTFSLCKACEEAKVEKFILISTDKAVRPANIMGASKRLAEKIVLSYQEKVNKNSESNLKNKEIIFTMVRFGNVLNYSGSVIPLFRKQIASGGPLTLTHKDIIRYFMTISEACELVLQASNLAKGGEVFILDMGKPMSIINLAMKMIQLSGKTIKDKANQSGDIEIKTVGLREGEKLYEELLVDKHSKPTSHPLIFKETESNVNFSNIKSHVMKLSNLIKANDTEGAQSVL